MRAYEITQQLTTPGCTVLTAEYISMMGFYSDWPVSVEFTAGLSEDSYVGKETFRQQLKTMLFATY